MNILPNSMNVEVEVAPPIEELQVEGFCEYAYDFENNELLTKDGKHYYVYGNEAMKIWIYKAMITSRFKYSAYTDRFGTEVFDLIGEVISSKVKQMEIKRYITEAIMVHPFMKAVINISLSRYKAGVNVVVDYTTIFNDKVVSVECLVPIE